MDTVSNNGEKLILRRNQPNHKADSVAEVLPEPLHCIEHGVAAKVVASLYYLSLTGQFETILSLLALWSAVASER